MYKCECDEENPQALPEASVQGGYDGVLAVSQLQISFTSWTLPKTMTSEYYIKKTSNAQLKLEMQLTNGNKCDFYTMPQVNGKWQKRKHNLSVGWNRSLWSKDNIRGGCVRETGEREDVHCHQHQHHHPKLRTTEGTGVISLLAFPFCSCIISSLNTRIFSRFEYPQKFMQWKFRRVPLIFEIFILVSTW